MDFSKPLGTEYRVVKKAEHRGQPVRIVSGARTYETDANDLWNALTDAERIARWFAPVTGEFKVGGRYQVEGNAGGEITECDPAEAFELTWEFGGNISWVRVKLSEEGSGTRLTLEHIMSMDEASESHWKKYGPGATGVGWDLSFLGLGMHLASGEPVNQEESNAWMATADGKQFLRQCASAWGKAHTESGEDEAIAAAMARQTGDFYTGESQSGESDAGTSE